MQFLRMPYGGLSEEELHGIGFKSIKRLVNRRKNRLK